MNESLDECKQTLIECDNMTKYLNQILHQFQGEGSHRGVTMRELSNVNGNIDVDIVDVIDESDNKLTSDNEKRNTLLIHADNARNNEQVGPKTSVSSKKHQYALRYM